MDLPKRKPLRLVGYDYSQAGLYFITICTHEKVCTLGDIVGQGLCPCRLSPLGVIVEEELRNLPVRFPQVTIDHYVIMPNHVHMMIALQTLRQGQSPCPTLGAVIGAMKSISTKRANVMDGMQGRKIWQFRYHDHIITSEKEYLKIWEYIDTNPLKWHLDRYYI